MQFNIQRMKQILPDLFINEGPERVGFILNDNTIVEVTNVASDPMEGFMVSPLNVVKYTEGAAWASWHTHPQALSNLSGDDYYTFQDYFHMVHFIVGIDGVKAYQYDIEKKVVVEV